MAKLNKYQRSTDTFGASATGASPFLITHADRNGCLDHLI